MGGHVRIDVVRDDSAHFRVRYRAALAGQAHGSRPTTFRRQCNLCRGRVPERFETFNDRYPACRTLREAAANVVMLDPRRERSFEECLPITHHVHLPMFLDKT